MRSESMSRQMAVKSRLRCKQQHVIQVLSSVLDPKMKFQPKNNQPKNNQQRNNKFNKNWTNKNNNKLTKQFGKKFKKPPNSMFIGNLDKTSLANGNGNNNFNDFSAIKTSLLLSDDDQRSCLPITAVRSKIIDAVKNGSTVVFLGETGSGKTTQIPQYLYESGFVPKIGLNGMIAVTQPRRVAAITIAQRVANEMGTQVGEVVGYSVRFEDNTSVRTKIKYLTDGTLLREAISDPLLTKYKVIILDEVHERTVQTDILLGVVKKAQQHREDKQMPVLKVILMSATMDCDHFAKYFNNAPVYYILGRQHTIQMNYTTEKQSDYINSALITVFQIHQNEADGDILVFCTGQEEIESMIRSVDETIPQLPSQYHSLKALPLYSALPNALQQKVFNKLENCRKVIFATNIAETSITIPNIKYVVDTGKVKSRSFNCITGFESLKVQNISKAQACQRSGRAGRIMNGICYRLFTKEEYHAFRDHTIPELQRCNLANVLLHLIAIGIRVVRQFDFIDKPLEETITNSLHQLVQLGAIEAVDNGHVLTNIGKQMVLFPVEPKYSKMIITSNLFGCVEEIITIIALLSVDNLFYIPSTKKDVANEVHKKFNSSEGDLIKLLKIYRNYKSSKENKSWCNENYIHVNNLNQAIKIRKQLAEVCAKAAIPVVSSNNNLEAIRKCLSTGLLFNVALLQRDGTYKTKCNKQEVQIHPSSCLFGSKPETIVFNELVQTSKSYMRNITVVDPQWFN